jgi:RHS repeat-associated protein
VSWFSSAWNAVTHPSQLVSDGEHLLGQVTDQGAHLVGRGLTDIGLGQLGNTVDGWGDDAAGALDPELQLGQTSDPTQLIHGDPAAIRQTSTQLGQFSDAFGQTATGLNAIDTSHWTGTAAEAFRAKYAPEPGKWGTASNASGMASDALSFYADTVQWAQAQAREAIALYGQGQNLTSDAVTAYNDQVTAYNAAAKLYDTQVQAGQNPGPRPVQPAPFTDPGESLRQRAQEILSAARSQRDREGTAAAGVVSQVTNEAPASPGLWSQVTDTATDWGQSVQLGQASFTAGVLTGVADIGKLVRTVNPTDPWNMEHPAEYLAGLSSVGAGLVHDVVHPQDLVGQLMSGAGSDPAEWAGKLVPQVALAVATGGGGTAADAVTDAGIDAATDTATDTGPDAAANAAKAPDDATTAGDPVDVATGDVIVPQVDVRLAGRLPLMVERVHRSNYQGGRWFGRSWASTLDQRLVVTGQAVVFAAENGAALCYPRPAAEGFPVLPVAGRQWPLARDRDGYTVTDPQAGVVRRFAPRSGFYLSAAGEGELPLVSVTDRTGCKIRFEYTQDGAPDSVAHDGGYRLRVIVSGARVAGLMLAGSGPDGIDLPLVRYGYNAAGDLAEVFNSSGIPQRFSYDLDGRLTAWEDRNGFSYRYSYDENGRCVRGVSPDGTLSGTFAYDRVSMVTSYTDAAGAVTRYQVTARGQVTAITDPLGNMYQFSHDACDRLVARTDPLGRTTRWSYDGSGNLAGVTRADGSRSVAVYDDMNLPLAVTQPEGTSWRQEYNGAGNLVRRTGPDGAVTEYGYDHRGYLASVTGPAGDQVTIECDGAGLPLVLIGADGGRTSYERDGFGRVTAVTEPGGAVTRVEWTVEGWPAARTFADGTVERYAYDGEGNLTGHIDPAGGVTRAEYGGFGQMLARTWPDGTRSTLRYDHEMRLTTVTHDDLTWRYEYDPAGRLIAETDYNGAVTRYVRDGAGQLTHRVNAAGQEISFGYDLLGNQTERTADGALTVLGYDRAGRLNRARGPSAELVIERDVMGRVTAQTCNGRTVRSAYDPAGRRVARVTPSGALARWEYDEAGRPAVLRSAGQQLRFGYDQAGRETSRELPGGLRLAQEWDEAGRLAVQTLASTGLMAGSSPASPAQRLLPGPGDRAAGGLLQRRSYSYRADGCLSSLEDLLSGPRQLMLDPGGRVTGMTGPDWSEQYRYDPLGNVTGATWPAPPPGPAGSELDGGVQGPREFAGTLITRAGDVRYEHDAQGRIILRQRARLSRKPDTWRYRWDADSRLIAVTTPDGTTWRYQYDPLGRRIGKQRFTQDGQVAEQVTFTWDEAVVCEQEVTPGSPGGGLVTTWDYQPGTPTPLTQLTASAAADPQAWHGAAQEDVDRQFYAIVTDLIGTPSELVSSDGALAGYQQHTLWGGTLWHPSGASTPLRFPGQYADDESGLHYNLHRYYDPATGRYLASDPLGLAPAPNPYAYVSNPHILADPLGLNPSSGPPGKIQFTKDGFGNNAAQAAADPGYQDVIIHGNPYGVAVKSTDPLIFENDFANMIKADPNYAGGPIRLISCSTGVAPAGGAAFASKLSDLLGVPVKAPTNTIWADSDGSLTIGAQWQSPDGRWVTFGSPGG